MPILKEDEVIKESITQFLDKWKNMEMLDDLRNLLDLQKQRLVESFLEKAKEVSPVFQVELMCKLMDEAAA